jgi:hypothetical protein
LLDLTPKARQVVQDLATEPGVSAEAVEGLLVALAAGHGTQAQFNHPELGGLGQWQQGGLIMVGDMFNHGLKHKVDRLCHQLSGLLRDQTVFAAKPAAEGQPRAAGAAPGAWWPADLGSPASSGFQNDMSYAYFPAARRLAVRREGEVQVYDTGDHTIGGVSQQQGADRSLTFSSQHGVVRLADLPRAPMVETTAQEAPPAQTPAGPADSGDVLATIERLAALREKNILTQEEFATKKAELLSRL